ncbi:MAG: coproporphyrinogen III oxidase family protein [Calditrichaeota bacterium]|nr:MAG: coproporphyrinogen III oxidase family protein [Calditrichota bacterium]
MLPAKQRERPSKTAALYLHIPFCAKRCNYCDFYTVAEQEKHIPAYLDALVQEIEIYGKSELWVEQSFSTIYFGGGTPSLLAPDQVERILSTLRNNFHFTQNPEITFEVNPGTTAEKKLQDYADTGINRLSIGVQSFRADELKKLDRLHSVEEAENTVARARKAGIQNLSIDLMFALSGQKPSNWRYSLERAIAMKPEHISAYNLTIENGTPLHQAVKAGIVKPVSELRQRIFYSHTIEYLERHGYKHYEVSNYALPNFESRHNSKYWDGSLYLGLGASAHSFDGDRRFWNVKSFSQYIKNLQDGDLPIIGEENLSPTEKQFEMILLGLRQSRGVSIDDFENRFAIDFREKFQPQLKKLLSQKPPLAKLTNGSLTLTREGWLLCDAVCAEFA